MIRDQFGNPIKEGRSLAIDSKLIWGDSKPNVIVGQVTKVVDSALNPNEPKVIVVTTEYRFNLPPQVQQVQGVFTIAEPEAASGPTLLH